MALHTWAAGDEIKSADLNASFVSRVATTGNETVAGIKTFSSIPLLPASDPTTDNQAVRKAFINGDVVAGDILNVRVPDSAVLGGSYAEKLSVIISRGGEYRIKFTVTAGVATTTAYGRIYRNGVAVGTEQHVHDGASTEFSEDIDGWAAGETLSVYGYYTGNSGTVSNLKVYSSYYPVPALVQTAP